MAENDDQIKDWQKKYTDRLNDGWRALYTPEEVADTIKYINSANNEARKLIGNVPVNIMARLRAYFQNPTVEMRNILSTDLYEEIIRLAKETYKDMPGGEHPGIHQRAAFFAGTYFYIIARAKEVINPSKDLSVAGSSLYTEMVGKTGWSLPEIPEEEAAAMHHFLGAMLVPKNNTNDWFQLRMTQFLSACQDKRRLVESLKAKEEAGPDSQLKADNDGLATSITFLQRYTPKQCVAPALPGQKTKEWLISEPLEAWRASRFHPCYGYRLALFGSSGKIDSSARESANFNSFGSELRVTILPGIRQDEATMSFAIGPDCELHSITGQRIKDYLPDEYQKGYEQLRSEALCIYYDSVIPVYVTELVDQEVSMVEAAIDKAGDKPNEMEGKLRRLVLARRLVVETLKDEIIEELDHPKRDLIRHEVSGHRMRIPAHWRAGPNARALCLKDLGVVLPEFGETYVKKHNRGNLENKSSGHKARFTAGKMATANGGENP